MSLLLRVVEVYTKALTDTFLESNEMEIGEEQIPITKTTHICPRAVNFPQRLTTVFIPLLPTQAYTR